MAWVDQPGLHQRTNEGDGAGRPAARIRHPRRLGDQLALPLGHLGKAEDPAGGHAMRGRGVDQPRAERLGQRRRLAGGVVGQTQDGDIRLGQRLAPRSGVLSALGRDLHQGDVGAILQPLADLQPGGADFAVDEDLVCHGRFPLIQALSDRAKAGAGQVWRGAARLAGTPLER